MSYGDKISSFSDGKRLQVSFCALSQARNNTQELKMFHESAG
jgi:hypothetical protein